MGRFKAILRNSKELQNGEPKAPQPSDIEYGEFAINYLAENEYLYLKQADNTIVGLPIGELAIFPDVFSANANAVDSAIIDIENGLESVVNDMF